MKKTLIVFYSRTGNTKKIAQEVAKLVPGDIEEIIDEKNRNGLLGWLISGMDAFLKKYTSIKQPEKNPSQYDIVIIGTPIWATNISTPIRTYMHNYKDGFKNTAFFCTSAGDRPKDTLKIFKDMEKLCSKNPVALVSFSQKDVKANSFEKIKEFAKKLNR
ncbi:MAG: hypothetical protein J7J57_04380 [Caldisericaceae bacterium]|nr:hypothetical protein [Caldisericaceae bacterium]RLD20990.1 MAG: hypothetical protein DRI33_00435 [Caldisericota bacterium]